MTLPANFPATFLALQNAHYGPAVIFAAKMAIAWPFSYHLLNGLRHMAWDLGYGFSMPDLYKTGYVVLALSLVLSTYLSLM